MVVLTNSGGGKLLAPFYLLPPFYGRFYPHSIPVLSPFYPPFYPRIYSLILLPIVTALSFTLVCFFLPQMRGALFLEVLQYQDNAFTRRGKPLTLVSLPKIRLISNGSVSHVSDIKLIRTDTTL